MRPVALITILALLLVPGCAKPRDENRTTYEIERSFRAPDTALTLTLKIDKRELSVADSFRCVIELKRGTEVVAELPVFADLEQSFAPLLVRDRRDLPDRIENRHVVKAQEYELEPLVSGDYTIKPFALKYKLGETEHELQTEPIALKVTSLGADDPRAALRDIAGPVELKTDRSRWWMWALLGGGLVAGGGVVFIALRRRRRPSAAARRLTAHEIAFDALRALREKDYVGRGLIKEFYLELSAVLRWYIEERFGLHAPEQTTEEFLDGISRDGTFDLRRRTLLTEFLEHCDLVKFAKYGPTPDEIQGAFTSATTFIDETRETPADVV